MQTMYQRSCWLLTGMLTATAIWAGVVRAEDKPDPATDETYQLMRVFVDTFQEIDRSYVNEVDRRKLVEAAVRGMLSTLDPYSDYISPDDLPHFTEAISQEFSGVGIRVEYEKEQKTIRVVSPLPGSPAYAAGIHAGDRIIEIDGKPVAEFPASREIETAVEMLRGKRGEKVEMGIKRLNSDEMERIELVRDTITLPTVLGDKYKESGEWNLMLDEEQKIGYLRLTHFTPHSAAEVREALKSLKKDGMRALILDLRFNPGGLLQSALDISDLFIESGVIVSTRGRNTISRDFPAKSFGTYTGFPMAILVNHFSASASEIVSACLQDHKRAIVVGERSWGKGSVQDVIDLEDGKSVLKLTTQSYHRPSGKNIHRFEGAKETDEWGVSPDEGYEVKFSLEDLRKYQEYRRNRDLPENKPSDSFDDRQLKAALKYLTEQLSPAAQTGEAEAKEKEEQPAARTDDNKAARLPLFPVLRMHFG